MFLAGVLSSVLVKEFHLGKAALPPLLASSFVGMLIGVLLLGRLADRLGRRGAFLLNLGCDSVFSLLGAFSPGAAMLLVTRFLAGIGLGAEPPLADTYLTDLLPARNRGRFIAWPTRWLSAACPWSASSPRAHRNRDTRDPRPALDVRVRSARCTRCVPASPRSARVATVLDTMGRTDEAARVVTALENEARGAGHELKPARPAQPEPAHADPRALLRPPYRRRVTMMAIFHLLQTFGYYGFGRLVPLVLTAKGYPISQSLLFTAVTYLGYHSARRCHCRSWSGWNGSSW